MRSSFSSRNRHFVLGATANCQPMNNRIEIIIKEHEHVNNGLSLTHLLLKPFE